MNTARIPLTAAPEAETSRCARASTAVPGGTLIVGGIGAPGAGTRQNASAFERLVEAIAHLRPTPRAIIAGADALRRQHYALVKARGWGSCTQQELGQLARMRVEAERGLEK